ncbi:hypothetical protein DY000_02010694 [Brassica cretica]|uniref:Dynein light chain n=1 Tax=Brassica cretica TaxID=69181 RepID=A0ABQ7BYS5_BRACR|nr:hypothetical protein DY000_02010694 [Brassica cretica]
MHATCRQETEERVGKKVGPRARNGRRPHRTSKPHPNLYETQHIQRPKHQSTDEASFETKMMKRKVKMASANSENAEAILQKHIASVKG